MGSHSRNKGKRGEREAVKLLREHWGCPNARRSAQVDGGLTADIVGGPPGLHLEVKHHKKIGAVRFWEQAFDDCFGGNLPVVLMREDGGQWMVMFEAFRAGDFVRGFLQGLDMDEHARDVQEGLARGDE